MRTINRLAILAALAPSATRTHHGRAPFGRGPVRNAEGGAAGAAGGADGGTGKTPTTPSKDPPAGEAEGRSFSQADLDRIVAREKGKAAKELTAAQARLAEFEAREAEAEGKTKGAVEGVEARAKREAERIAKERDEAKAAAASTDARYRATLIDGAAARALAGLEFVGEDAAELVETKLRSMLKVEQEGDRDVVYLVDGKTEIAVTDREKIAAHIKKRWPSQIRAQSGAGAVHGKGAGVSAADRKNLSPAQKITLGMKGRA